MKRYIEAEALEAYIKEYACIPCEKYGFDRDGKRCCFCGFGLCLDGIKRQKTADVRENVHGKLIVKDESYWRPHYSGDIQVNKAGLYCSECNKRLAKAQKYKNFCPNCGVDLRERRDDE